MMAEKSDFCSLIDRIYGAATNDDLWPEVLEQLHDYLGGVGATLLFTDTRFKPIDAFISHNVADEAVSSYRRYYYRHDIRMHRAMPAFANKVVTDLEIVDQAIIDRHEFYQDFLRAAGHKYIVSLMMNLNDGSYAFCSFHRAPNEEHADQATIDNANLILPHLRRSLQMRRRLLEAGASGQAMLDLLERLAQAVVLVDGAGLLLWHNSPAGTLLALKDGLTTVDRELRADSPPANEELHRLIKAAIEAPRTPSINPGGMMTIRRPSLKRAFQVLVAPLARAPSLNLAADQLRSVPAAALFLIDPERRPQPRAQMLGKLYDLTPAEARLASALAAGGSSRDYAAKAGLSINYVRWLVKQVQSKTDTRRLADLVRLLGSQIAFLRDDEGSD